MLRVWFVALLGMLATVLVPVGTGSAATTSYLCWGYDGCQKAGYSHSGYKKNASKMWWRMYSGHNCTNYVAYRMIKNGYSDQRPWSGSGNATNWGVAMKNITDTTPTVGSVAWWRAGQGGVGSAGHVAYVEQVVSKNEIIVSQDSWGGDFSWRRITKASGSWPTGFIHFTDRTIESKSAPRVTGTAKVGEQVRMIGATWKGSPTKTSRQWYADGVAIPGATKARYVLSADEAGKTLTARITASREGFASATVESPATGPVAKGEFAPIAEPELVGTPELDQTLTVTAEDWKPSPATARIRWFADGKRIKGQKATELKLAAEHVDAKIHVKLVAKAPGYVKATTESAPTAPVTAGQLTLTTETEVRGKPKVGNTLTATPARVQEKKATTTVEWLREDGTVVGTGTTYVVQPADIGQTLAARTTTTRPSYSPAESIAQLDREVFGKPTLTFEANGKKRAAVVKVKVSMPGFGAVPGTVRVRVAKVKQEVELVNGRAKVRIKGLKTGKRKVRVRFLRDDPFRGIKSEGRVKIK